MQHSWRPKCFRADQLHSTLVSCYARLDADASKWMDGGSWEGTMTDLLWDEDGEMFKCSPRPAAWHPPNKMTGRQSHDSLLSLKRFGHLLCCHHVPVMPSPCQPFLACSDHGQTWQLWSSVSDVPCKPHSVGCVVHPFLASTISPSILHKLCPLGLF